MEHIGEDEEKYCDSHVAMSDEKPEWVTNSGAHQHVLQRTYQFLRFNARILAQRINLRSQFRVI